MHEPGRQGSMVAPAAAQSAGARARNDTRWWIGLSDRSEESHFAWHDGAPVEITYWSRGEPDKDACNQDCAALKADAGGTWHDTHCGQHEPFICR